jgi:polyphosphate glucokinase
MNLYGIDIGATSIKHGLVHIDREITVTDFDQVYVSKSAGTQGYAQALSSLLEKTTDTQGVGVGFPSTVHNEQVLNLSIAYNDVWTAFAARLNDRHIPCFAVNDADAAGIAEVYRPAADALRHGVTAVITLGTGIGSGLFLDGKLLPNTEVGLIQLHGMPAEKYTAASVKTQENLSLEDWAARLQEYLAQVEIILKPDYLVLGGGISADFEAYRALLKTHAALLPAFYRNHAGVIGAAMYAAGRMET